MAKTMTSHYLEKMLLRDCVFLGSFNLTFLMTRSPLS